MDRLSPLPWQAALWSQIAARAARLPHALLLHGPRGLGQRHFLQALAQALLCEAPRDDATLAPACGACAGCALMAADNHPDFRWLVPEADRPARADAATEETVDEAEPARTTRASRAILIDAVRATGEFLALAPHRGGRRIVLLAPAEALNGPAANALLKMLEEPPPGAVFLVASDDLDAVLPTVRSRCLLLRAPQPAPAAALAWLEAQGVPEAAERLAEAGGAPLAPLEAADDDRVLAPALRGRLLELLGRGARINPADVLAAVPRDVPLAAAIRLFQRWGWDLLAERAAGRVRYYPKHQRTIVALARSCDPQRLLGWLAELTEAQATAEHPLNAKLAVERAMFAYATALDATRDTAA
jgi:DNA polymerase-3 subunit delta'